VETGQFSTQVPLLKAREGLLHERHSVEYRPKQLLQVGEQGWQIFVVEYGKEPKEQELVH
jgi:hypothetical protein